MDDRMANLRERSFGFALEVVKLVRRLESVQNEWVLSRQLLKSGTSIGANIREARFAQSTPDFVSKLSIALKEAEESSYWLELLRASDSISETEFSSLGNDASWLVGTLVNIVKRTKEKQQS